VKHSKLRAVITMLREDETIQATIQEIKPELLPAAVTAVLGVVVFILVCAI
jgi:hypothetical protein